MIRCHNDHAAKHDHSRHSAFGKSAFTNTWPDQSPENFDIPAVNLLSGSVVSAIGQPRQMGGTLGSTGRLTSFQMLELTRLPGVIVVRDPFFTLGNFAQQPWRKCLED